MNKDDLTGKIKEILNSGSGFGFNMYACLKKEDGLVGVKFDLEDKGENSFKDSVSEKIAKCISDRFQSENIDLKQVDDIHDNTNSFFEIIQDDTYNPFAFIRKISDDTYNDNDKANLSGFLFRFNVNLSKVLWAYQQVYPVTVPKKKNGLFVYSHGSVYKEFTKELLRIDYRVDLIIIGNSIITDNIKLLQSKFDFETFIRNDSQKALNLIEEMDVIEDITKIKEFEGAEKLTNAKKLMKIKNSPVLKMKKKDLIHKLKTLPRYAKKVKIKGDKIQITSNKDVIELLKILNDDYLKSELTNEDYESSNKRIEVKK